MEREITDPLLGAAVMASIKFCLDVDRRTFLRGRTDAYTRVDYLWDHSMPYLKIDYTDNLLDFPAPVILVKVNELLAESEAIRDEFDLKSSVSALSNYKIGTQEETRAFVYAQLYLFSGRSPETRKDLANRIASVLRRHVPRPPGVRILVSVEMIEMNQDTYRVETLEG